MLDKKAPLVYVSGAFEFKVVESKESKSELSRAKGVSFVETVTFELLHATHR